MEDLRPEEAADLVIDRVAEHGGDEEDGAQRGDVHAALAERGQRAGDEEQRIAGQEGEDDESGLGEDDEEEDGVDPQPVVLDEDGEVLVEVEDDVDELGEQFHAQDRALIEAAL